MTIHILIFNLSIDNTFCLVKHYRKWLHDYSKCNITFFDFRSFIWLPLHIWRYRIYLSSVYILVSRFNCFHFTNSLILFLTNKLNQIMNTINKFFLYYEMSLSPFSNIWVYSITSFRSLTDKFDFQGMESRYCLPSLFLTRTGF